jgi:ABC-type proline/glycine betaine transport system substrate-binding protein
VVPEYMKEKCPGLPNWEALKDEACAEAFSTAETAPKGRYLGGPVTWGGFDDERVEALDLPFEVIHAGTDAALFAELESAYQRKAPIMLWIYAPHWAPQNTRASGSNSRNTPPSATMIRLGHQPGWPMTAASRAARSGRSAGPA